MTREEAKKHIEIIKGYAEGKAIQVRPKFPINSKWRDVPEEMNMEFRGISTEYRIKPEPKLVPFTFEDAPLFRDKWVKDTRKDWTSRINTYVNDGVYISGSFKTWFELVQCYVFADTGEPCGKLAEE